MNSPLCFVAAGSGGHLVPCVTIAHNYHQNTNTSIMFFTADKPLENSILEQYDWIKNLHQLRLAKWPGKQIWLYPSFIFSFVSSCISSFNLLKKTRPYKIISMGGVISIPVCLAGRLLGIPIELYELNAVPGKANRFLSLFAQRIYICFEQAQSKLPTSKCILTPYPIRFGLQYNLAHTKKSGAGKTLLILGGSQGSIFINTLIMTWILKSPVAPSLAIIHQTGRDHIDTLSRFYYEHGIAARVFDYDNALDSYYREADLIVCRAGAGTLFETLFFQKSCITIPLENCADNHQMANAQALAERYPHLITVLRQPDLEKDPELFEYAIRITLHYEGQLSGFSPSVNT
jgi:UDP-N-acetylglucosamine--N-acetylmuramyl-(pentapeptide) pyrophosphoryl-undecaprenol N-acetylglucosamine transferase